MKLFGAFEFSGVDRLVINNNIVWIRTQVRDGKLIWHREHTTRYKPDIAIISKIQRYLTDEEYRVWFHNGTCNVEKIPWEIDVVAVTVQPHKTTKHTIKKVELIDRGVATACDYHR